MIEGARKHGDELSDFQTRTNQDLQKVAPEVDCFVAFVETVRNIHLVPFPVHSRLLSFQVQVTRCHCWQSSSGLYLLPITEIFSDS